MANKDGNRKIRLVNPYIVGRPVAGTEMFVGRDDIIKTVPSIFFNPNNALVIIKGPRRSGKTSVLRQLEITMPREKFEPVLFDLQPYTEKPMGELLWAIARSVARRLKMERPQKSDFDNEGVFFEEKFIPEVNKKLGERRLVLLFDEFDVLDPGTEQELPENSAIRSFVEFVGTLIEDNPGPGFIFAIGRSSDDLSVRFRRPLRYAARSFDIWTLPRPDAEKLIKFAERKGTLRYEDKAVDKIIELSNGHPYVVQLICSVIWEEKHHKSEEIAPTVVVKDVNEAVERALEAGEQAFVWMWDGLSPAEKIFASALAEATQASNSISENEVIDHIARVSPRLRIKEVEWAPKDLIKRKILSQESERYKFSVELFRLWVARFHPLEKTKDEIERIEPVAYQLYQTAERLYRIGNFEGAIYNCRLAIERNQKLVSAYTLMGDVLLEIGKIDEAIEVFEKGDIIDHAAVARRLSDAYIRKAETTEELDSKLEYYKKAFTAYKLQELSPVLKAIDSLIENGLLEKAEAVLNEFMDILGEQDELKQRFQSVKIERLISELTDMEVYEEWHSAIEIAQQLLELDTRYRERWQNKIKRYKIELEVLELKEKVETQIKTGNLKEAVIAIGKLLQLKPENRELLEFAENKLALMISPQFYEQKFYEQQPSEDRVKMLRRLVAWRMKNWHNKSTPEKLRFKKEVEKLGYELLDPSLEGYDTPDKLRKYPYIRFFNIDTSSASAPIVLEPAIIEKNTGKPWKMGKIEGNIW